MNNSTARSRSAGRAATLLVCAVALATSGSAASVRAATLAVNNLNDSGPGSLRQAIAAASLGDTIVFGVTGTDIFADNAAVGDPSASPFGSPGFAVAGGLANFGKLEVSGCSFTDNVVRGGRSVNAVSEGVGGAIGNFGGPATITQTQFTGNVAKAGDGGSGTPFVGITFGGAIGNAGVLTVH